MVIFGRYIIKDDCSIGNSIYFGDKNPLLLLSSQLYHVHSKQFQRQKLCLGLIKNLWVFFFFAFFLISFISFISCLDFIRRYNHE